MENHPSEELGNSSERAGVGPESHITEDKGGGVPKRVLSTG